MDVLIIGAGGHGKVVLDVLRASATHKPIGFLDADPALANHTVSGLPVLGQINLLPKLRQQKLKYAVVAIGDNRSRQSYIRTLRDHGFELANAVHPAAHVSPTAELGQGVVVCPAAVVGTEASIADGVIVNTGAVVDHECVVGECVHLAPGVLLAGRVSVGTGAFVGLGSRIIQCLNVGEWSMIGAGTTVIRDVPPNVTVVGTPAKVLSPRPT
jgi:UDP-perosamine 4-acetyltransferase